MQESDFLNAGSQLRESASFRSQKEFALLNLDHGAPHSYVWLQYAHLDIYYEQKSYICIRNVWRCKKQFWVVFFYPKDEDFNSQKCV